MNDHRPGNVKPMERTSDRHAIRKLGKNFIEVRSGEYDGVEITGPLGAILTSIHQLDDVPQQDRTYAHMVFMGGDTPQWFTSNAIGQALDSAITRAFADANLSKKEARQLAHAAREIADSVQNEQLYTPEGTVRILTTLGNIARPKSPNRAG